MPIDPSIALQARPFTLESPLAQAGQAMSLQNMLQQGDMNRLKMQQAQQEQAREREFRAAIANAKTPEEQLAVASRFMGPDKLGTMIQTSQDKQSRDRATAQMAMARLAQSAQEFERNYQARLRTVTTQEERLALERQKASFTQQLQAEAARLEGGRANYDFGFMPSPPPQPTVSPGPLSALQPQSAPAQTAPPSQPPGSLAAMLSPQEQSAMSTVRDHLQRGQIGSVSAGNPNVFMPSVAAPQPRPAAPMQAPPMAAPPGPTLTGQTALPTSAAYTDTPVATPPPVAAPTTAPGQPPASAARRPTLEDAPAGLPMRAKVEWLKAREKELARVDVNLMGGRESVFLNRVLTASNQVNKDLLNIVELPMSSSRGIFGGRSQGKSLFEAAKETLATTMTTQEVQSYNVLATGIQRNLAAIESAGLAPPNSLVHMMDAVVFKQGDTNFTKLQKLAQTRQVVEAGLETILSNPRLSPEQKRHAEELLAGVQKAVPFTGREILKLGTLQQSNPNATLKDVMDAEKRGVGTPGAYRDPEKERRYQEWKRNNP